MSSIFQTRRGFSYQDKYAVYTFLVHLRDNDIKEFFVDFPLPDQKSLDVRLISNKNIEEVSEVKTGEVFQESGEEIGNAIMDLYRYKNGRDNIRPNLIISKGLKQKISTCWDKVRGIQKYKIIAGEAKNSLIWLKSNLKTSLPEDELFKFSKQLNLDEFENDLKNNERDEYCDVDSKIMDIIRDIGKMIGVTALEAEYHPKILMNELIVKCVECAGTKRDICPLLLKVVIEYFAMRKFLDEKYVPRGNRKDEALQIIIEEVENNFRVKLGVSSMSEGQQINNIVEGEEIKP